MREGDSTLDLTLLLPQKAARQAISLQQQTDTPSLPSMTDKTLEPPLYSKSIDSNVPSKELRKRRR
jgi:hypothetical protein